MSLGFIQSLLYLRTLLAIIIVKCHNSLFQEFVPSDPAIFQVLYFIITHTVFSSVTGWKYWLHWKDLEIGSNFILHRIFCKWFSHISIMIWQVAVLSKSILHGPLSAWLTVSPIVQYKDLSFPSIHALFVLMNAFMLWSRFFSISCYVQLIHHCSPSQQDNCSYTQCRN
jgi:hypothetical protein